MNAYEKVKCTREVGRATAKDYIDAMFDGFVEFHGDRRFGDDPALIGGVATLDGKPVTVLGIEKGRDVSEHVARNFGCVSPEGYRKALRLMKQAEKFSRPVVCIVDTQGANCGIGAEERGEGAAIAENLYEMMDLHTPVLTLMVGEGSSGGALALAVADEIWTLENAYFTVVSPEACASILYKDSARAPEAAEHLKLAAQDLIEMGIIERVIEEPRDFTDPAQCKAYMEKLRDEVAGKLHALRGKKMNTLLSDRYEKYRKIGRCAPEGAMPAPKKH